MYYLLTNVNLSGERENASKTTGVSIIGYSYKIEITETYKIFNGNSTQCYMPQGN